MNHVDRDSLLKYALETLKPGDQAAIRQHLGECKSCSAALGELQSDIARVGSIEFHIGEGVPPQLPRKSGVLSAAVRFAAILAVGFIAGYVTGGVSSPPRATIVQQHFMPSPVVGSVTQPNPCSEVDVTPKRGQ